METLLMLHGAIGSAAQLQPLADCLGGNFKIHCLEFTGHGASELSDKPFSIELFADDVLQFMLEENLDRVNIFGYSMGGYVGMYLAKHYPEKVNKLVTLATKYYWDESTAAQEAKKLDAEKMEQKVPAFADLLRERHKINDWKEVLKRTAEMMEGLGARSPLTAADYPSIESPVLLLLGDRDKMITVEETISVYKALPNGLMGMLPATPHPIEQADADLLSYMIRDFLQKEILPVPR